MFVYTFVPLSFLFFQSNQTFITPAFALFAFNGVLTATLGLTALLTVFGRLNFNEPQRGEQRARAKRHADAKQIRTVQVSRCLRSL